jgi:transcriptional regulator with XRE-family HTH domain
MNAKQIDCLLRIHRECGVPLRHSAAMLFEAKGLSMEALAERAGCPRDALCQALAGDIPPSPALREAMAEALGVDPWESATRDFDLNRFFESFPSFLQKLERRVRAMASPESPPRYALSGKPLTEGGLRDLACLLETREVHRMALGQRPLFQLKAGSILEQLRSLLVVSPTNPITTPIAGQEDRARPDGRDR